MFYLQKALEKLRNGENKEEAFLSTGFRNWKKALDSFKEHQKSKCDIADSFKEHQKSKCHIAVLTFSTSVRQYPRNDQ